MYRFPPGVRRIGLVIAEGCSRQVDIGPNGTSLSSSFVVFRRLSSSFVVFRRLSSSFVARWVRVEEALMLNINRLCRRGLVPVLGLVSCAIFTPIAWGAPYTGVASSGEELPCESLGRKMKTLFRSVDSWKSAWSSKQIRDEIRKFVEDGREFIKEETTSLDAADSYEDKGQRKQPDKDFQNFPYCNGNPLFLFLQNVRGTGVLRIRFDKISKKKELGLREIFTVDMMRNICPRSWKLEDFLVSKEALQYSKKALEYLQYNEEAWGSNSGLWCGGNFDDMFTINYDKLGEALGEIESRKQVLREDIEDSDAIIEDLEDLEDLGYSDSYASEAQQCKQEAKEELESWYDLETHFLGSEASLRALVKAGALELVAPDRPRAADRFEPGARDDFQDLDLVKMLQDPNNPIEWEGQQKKETSVF